MNIKVASGETEVAVESMINGKLVAKTVKSPEKVTALNTCYFKCGSYSQTLPRDSEVNSQFGDVLVYSADIDHS